MTSTIATTANDPSNPPHVPLGGATVFYATETGDRFFQRYSDVTDARNGARALLSVPGVFAVSITPADPDAPIERLAHRTNDEGDGRRVAAITQARKLLAERAKFVAVIQEAYANGGPTYSDSVTDGLNECDYLLGQLVPDLI